MCVLWCEYLWPGSGSDSKILAGAVLTVEGGRIVSLDSGVDIAPPDATKLTGLTTPAAANAHSHAFHRVLRGRAQRDRGDFWTWRDIMYRAAGKLNPESYHELATAVFAEMACAGYGSVGEFHYVHHDLDGRTYADANAMGEALVAAADRVGVRLTLLDTLYLHGGIGPGSGTGPRSGGGASSEFLDLDPVQRRFADESAEAWADRVTDLQARFNGPTVRIGSAVHSVRAVDPASMEVVAAWADNHQAPIHVHVSEQPAENEQSLAHYGCSPIALLAEYEILGPRTTVIHATHTDAADHRHLASTDTTCCLCPTTERDLADGIGPGTDLVRAGVELCIGSDSQAAIDPFVETRSFELQERLRTLRRGGNDVASLWAIATANGHRALGWPESGELVEGGPCDLMTIGLNSARIAGWSDDSLLETTMFAATADDVTDVMIDGRWVTRGGNHVSIDTEQALHESITNLVG